MTTYTDSVNYAKTIIARDVKLPKMAMIQRLTMIAAKHFTNENYFTIDTIKDEDRANHYGLNIGDTRKVSKNLYDLPANVAASIVRHCNKEVKNSYK